MLAGKKVIVFIEDFSKPTTRRVNIKNAVERNILLLTESNRFALMKRYLLRR